MIHKMMNIVLCHSKSTTLFVSVNYLDKKKKNKSETCNLHMIG